MAKKLSRELKSIRICFVEEDIAIAIQPHFDEALHEYGNLVLLPQTLSISKVFLQALKNSVRVEYKQLEYKKDMTSLEDRSSSWQTTIEANRLNLENKDKAMADQLYDRLHINNTNFKNSMATQLDNCIES